MVLCLYGECSNSLQSDKQREGNQLESIHLRKLGEVVGSFCFL